MARPQTITDEQILETAKACYLEHGPAVSTDVIAGLLGVSPQALLKRYGTRNELMIAALRPPAVAPWVPLAESGPDDRPIAVQLASLLEQVAVYFDDIARQFAVLRWSHIDLAQVMADYKEPPPLVGIRTLAAWLERAALRDLIQPTDFRGTAMMLLSALHGPTMLTDILGLHPTGHTRKEYVHLLVATVLHGLLPQSDEVAPLNRSQHDPHQTPIVTSHS